MDQDNHQMALARAVEDTATRQIQGMRQNWADRLIANGHFGYKQNRAGYLNALYVIRNSFLPPAYIRNPEIEAFEQEINFAIRTLEQKQNKL